MQEGFDRLLDRFFSQAAGRENILSQADRQADILDGLDLPIFVDVADDHPNGIRACVNCGDLRHESYCTSVA